MTNWLNNWRQWIIYPAIIALFAIISIIYFSPSIFDGRALFQQDIAGASGTAQDVRDDDPESLWTNSLFGGMPMYQISPSYPSTRPLEIAQNVYTLKKPFNLLQSYAWLLFAMMIGFFLLMKALNLNHYLATLGAIAWTFSSYFIILIAAGHIWKLTVLCFIPPTIAGLIWIIRGKRWLGSIIFALFTGLQIMANHVQMTYYFLFVMAAIWIAYLIRTIMRQVRWREFIISTLFALIAGLVGIGMNATSLYHTYEYAQETMRGGSNLTQTDDQSADVNDNGLQKDYITQWSYGIGETWTLLIPNTKGGASGYMDQHMPLIYKKAPHMAEYIGKLPSYWGNQPFTSGPVYIGAIICLLFIIGCIQWRSPYKWALLAVTLLTIMLSWGKNFMPLTDWFIDHFPMYDKFRAVSSILVVAELTIPLIAVMGLYQWFKRPNDRSLWRTTWISSATMVGLLLLFYITPSTWFNFTSQQEQTYFSSMIAQAPEYSQLLTGLQDIRIALFQQDVLRSLFLIVIGFVLLTLTYKNKLKTPITISLIALITLVDLWNVDKRYLNDAMFIPQSRVEAQAAPQSEADRTIMADHELGFRVMNLGVNTFNDATASRWHHSIGGYHAAKLQRYQEIIDQLILKDHRGVLDMLNTKYFIANNDQGKSSATLNPNTFGPAWFCTSIVEAQSPNEVITHLQTISDTPQTAFVEPDEWDTLQALNPNDSTAYIRLVEYKPSTVKYEFNSQQGGAALFSEIYYPHGWHATLEDGTKLPIHRANYILRGIQLPAGQHTLTMTFAPQSIRTTETIAWIAYIMLIFATIASIAIPRYVDRKKKSKIQTK